MKTKKCRSIFTIDNYNSDEGMLTSVWGPSMWHTLHTISFNYPVNPSKEHKKNYKKFILGLKDILPCKYCRDNLKENFKKAPLTSKVMKNRESFSLYIYNLHEKINKLLGKESGLSYDDVRIDMNILEQIVKKKKNNQKNTQGCLKPLHKFKSKGVIE